MVRKEMADMCTIETRKLNRRQAALKMAAGLSAAALLQRSGRAATALPITRIEEDWTLQIGNPDPVNNAPLIKTVMSAQADLLGYCAFYDINYEMQGSPPKFVPGGFGIEMWNPSQSWPTTVSYPTSTLLKTANEKISWTQRLDLSQGKLSFGIWNGSSTTWGSASGQVLNVAMPCSMADLSGYSSSLSVAESGPTWWPDRVSSLVLKTVRYYDSSGKLTRTDSTGYQAYS
jgi:hypothetical protein